MMKGVFMHGQVPGRETYWQSKEIDNHDGIDMNDESNNQPKMNIDEEKVTKI